MPTDVKESKSQAQSDSKLQSQSQSQSHSRDKGLRPLSLPMQSASRRRQIVFAFWAVILIGLPLWYKTTNIYRARLPLDDMISWNDKIDKLRLPITIEITSLGMEVDDVIIKMQKAFQSVKEGPLAIYDITAVEKKDNIPPKPGRYLIDIKLNNGKESKLRFRDDRILSFEIPLEWEKVTTELLLKQLPFLFYNEGIRLQKGNDSNNKDFRIVKYSPEYQLTFSLLNGHPIDGIVSWDIGDAIEGYLRPLFDQLSPVSNFTITSQVQHYASLTFDPKQRVIEQSNITEYILYPDDLPHFINSAEWSLASAVSSNPTIHLMLYVPRKDQRPMHIVNGEDGKHLNSNAFLIPGWGGIIISNPSVDSKTKYDVKDLHEIMATFISHLRELLGVQNPAAKPDILKDHPSSNPGRIFYDGKKSSHSAALPFLEFDGLVRQRIIFNCRDAARTLSSLAKLVVEIRNMVIGEEIREGVEKAITALEKTEFALETGDYMSALKYSKDAIEQAEQAFFSPNMVSMLYFPDEHNYAIYTPLFAPISFPLIMSLIKEIRSMIRERKARKETKKKKSE